MNGIMNGTAVSRIVITGGALLDQTGQRVGKAAQLGHPASGQMQVACPTWVSQPVPQPQHVTQRGSGTRRGAGKHLKELEVLRDRPRYLRLLQHDLADQDGPRVTCVPPRQVAEAWPAPFQNRLGEAALGDVAPGDVAQAQAASPSYGRSRDGADSRFHTMTRLRK